MKPYYDHNGITIYHGDCREVLPQLPPVDAVVTDPPYNVGYSYASHKDNMDEVAYLEWLREVFETAGALLPEGGPLVWFWQGIRVANGEARACLPDGFHIHHLCGWFKREFAGDLWKGAHPAFCWEPIIWAVKGEAKYYGPRGGHAGRDMLIGNSSRHDTAAKGHPCPKTESVVSAVLQWVVPPGGLVIDPFAGSGTTLRVAKDLGVRAIGIEVEESYCEVAVGRLAQEVLL